MSKAAALGVSSPHSGGSECSSPSSPSSPKFDVPRHAERVGKYYLLNELGRGKFGSVFKAVHADGDGTEHFAVKVMQKKKLSVRRAQRIVREIKAMLTLGHHENIVSLLDAFETDTRVFLVMQYCPGGTVHDVQRKFKEKTGHPSLPEKVARHYFIQIIIALRAAIKSGVIHRDLKPANILLSRDQRTLLLADFGIAQVVDIAGGHVTLETVCGTAAYQAPEILHVGYDIEMGVKHRSYDGTKVDLWSAGVVLYELLSGHLPFSGSTEAKMHDRIMKGEFSMHPRIRAIPAAEDLISKLLVTDPEKRLSIDDVVQAPWVAEGLTKDQVVTLAQPVQPAAGRLSHVLGYSSSDDDDDDEDSSDKHDADSPAFKKELNPTVETHRVRHQHTVRIGLDVVEEFHEHHDRHHDSAKK